MAYVTNIFLCLIYPPCGEYLSLQMGFNSAPGSFYTVHDTYLTYVCNVGGQRMCTNTRIDGLVSIYFTVYDMVT